MAPSQKKKHGYVTNESNDAFEKRIFVRVRTYAMVALLKLKGFDMRKNILGSYNSGNLLNFSMLTINKSGGITPGGLILL